MSDTVFTNVDYTLGGAAPEGGEIRTRIAPPKRRELRSLIPAASSLGLLSFLSVSGGSAATQSVH